MSGLRVLIAGAGIAGPALAFWLARFGCKVTIVERNVDLRATGQQLDLSGQGVVIMRMMGIEDAVRAAVCPEPGIRVINEHGKSVAFMPANKAGEASFSATQEIEIMRGDLVRILYGITKDLPNVDYIFGTYVQNFTQDEGHPGGKVHATFANGTQMDCDIFVGADGSGSATRKLIMDPTAPDPRDDMGLHIAYYTAPGSAKDCYDWTWCHVPGGKIVMTRKDREDCIRVYLIVVGQSCEVLDKAETLEQKKAAVFDIFKDQSDTAQLPRFLRDLRDSALSDDLYSQHMTRINLPDGGWSKGRVLLLGDAAYSTSAGGLGTKAAFIGAYVLAGELARQWKESGQSVETFAVEKAAKEYERKVRPLMETHGQLPRWVRRLFAPHSKVGIWLLHIFVQIFVGLRIDRLLARLSTPEEAETLLYDNYFDL